MYYPIKHFISSSQSSKVSVELWSLETFAGPLITSVRKPIVLRNPLREQLYYYLPEITVLVEISKGNKVLYYIIDTEIADT